MAVEPARHSTYLPDTAASQPASHLLVLPNLGSEVGGMAQRQRCPSQPPRQSSEENWGSRCLPEMPGVASAPHSNWAQKHFFWKGRLSFLQEQSKCPSSRQSSTPSPSVLADHSEAKKLPAPLGGPTSFPVCPLCEPFLLLTDARPSKCDGK